MVLGQATNMHSMMWLGKGICLGNSGRWVARPGEKIVQKSNFFTAGGEKDLVWAGILSPPAARRSWLPLRLRLLRRDSEVSGPCSLGVGSPVACGNP